jgi:hypothetical protein
VEKPTAYDDLRSLSSSANGTRPNAAVINADA